MWKLGKIIPIFYPLSQLFLFLYSSSCVTYVKTATVFWKNENKMTYRIAVVVTVVFSKTRYVASTLLRFNNLLCIINIIKKIVMLFFRIIVIFILWIFTFRVAFLIFILFAFVPQIIILCPDKSSFAQRGTSSSNGHGCL